MVHIDPLTLTIVSSHIPTALPRRRLVLDANGTPQCLNACRSALALVAIDDARHMHLSQQLGVLYIPEAIVAHYGQADKELLEPSDIAVPVLTWLRKSITRGRLGDKNKLRPTTYFSKCLTVEKQLVVLKYLLSKPLCRGQADVPSYTSNNKNVASACFG